MNLEPLLCRAAALLLAVSLSGCGEAEKSVPRAPVVQPLRIVSSLPTKGAASYESKLMSQAIDLAISERGTPPGKPPVEHVKLDGGSDENGEWSPRLESANATLAANDPQVIAYIGPYTSGATGVALPITNRARLLTLGPTATWPGITLDGFEPGEPQKYNPTGAPNFARLSLPDSRQAEAAARWAKSLSLGRAYVLDDGSSYSAGLARRFVETASEIGLGVAGQGALLAEGSSEALAAKLAASGSDAIFFAPSNVANALKLSALLAQTGSAANVFVSDTAMSDQFLNRAGESAARWRYLYNGSAPAPGAPRWADFARSYRSAYGVQPTRAAANAYDLANLALDAADAAPALDRERITQRVLAPRNYPGASGMISFDARGDLVSSRVEGYRLEGKRFVLDRTIEW